MDVDLSPDVKWIGGSCYRVHRTNDNLNNVYVENDEQLTEEPELYTEEPCDINCTVEKLSTGEHRIKLPIPKVFWGRLIGIKGSTKNRIEKDTRTNIHIPRPHEEGDVTITSKNERDALLASSHIKELVLSARKNAKYTHFLSIPVQDQPIISKYIEFKEAAMRLDPNLDEMLFTSPNKLHLTLVVLLLVDKNEISQACDIFQQVSQMVTKKMNSKPLKVELKELNTFTDDLKNCSVVYSKVESDLLQEIANDVANLYYGTGFVKDKDIKTSVRLHLTLLNSSNLTKPDEKFYRKNKIYFDASILFKELKNFHFGSFQVKSIHVSEMGGGDDTKYYKSCAQFSI